MARSLEHLATTWQTGLVDMAHSFGYLATTWQTTLVDILRHHLHSLPQFGGVQTTEANAVLVVRQDSIHTRYPDKTMQGQQLLESLQKAFRACYALLLATSVEVEVLWRQMLSVPDRPPVQSSS